MNRVFPLCLVAGMLLLGTFSCKEKKKSDDIIVTKYVAAEPTAPIRLSNDVRRTDVKWLNSFYTVTIRRTAADSLPKLKDDTGQEYIDNIVTVLVQRSDSTVLLKKTFTKESFSSYVADNFRSQGFLENIIVQGVEGDFLKLGVSITRAGDEDAFIPLDILIDRMGGMRIKEGRLFEASDKQP